MSDRIKNSRWIVPGSAFLSGLTLAVFWPVSQFEFQAYDDQRYVTANAAIRDGLTRKGLAWAFDFHVSNWHPLTWISHMLDVQLFGLNPGAHHLTNVFLHIANTILLLLILNRMTGAFGRSAFVATLFAVHPMHVESVAWVAERKDVLSTFFFMLTLWAYTSYVKSKGQGPKAKVEERGREQEQRGPPVTSNKRAWLNYSVAMLFFTLGLLSKPMLVTLPFVLLLLDYWPLGRFQINNLQLTIKNLVPLVLEKIPFFLLAIGSSVLTFLAQSNGGSVASLQLFSWESRVANALAAYAGYLEKLIWPAKLAVLYLPPAHWSFSYLIVAALLIAGVTMLAVWQCRRRPYIVVGWLWFLGTLVPVIGLVQVGSQYMADRYSYVPFVGCFICVAWGGWDLATSKRVYKQDAEPGQLSSPPHALRKGEREARHFKDGAAAGETAAAGDLVPRGVLWLISLSLIVAAIAVTRHELEYWRTPESLFRHCIEATTENYVAYNNLGAILVNQRKYAEAKPFYIEALRINPAFPDSVMNMGTLLALQGEVSNAVLYFQQAVNLAPESAEGYGKLAVALSQLGRVEESISAYRESLRLNPDQVPACNNLAWILATHPNSHLRNGPEAVRLAEHACQLTNYKQSMLVGTLAAAYAEAGRFSDATLMAENAIALANASGQSDLAHKNQELKDLYQNRRAYQEAPK